MDVSNYSPLYTPTFKEQLRKYQHLKNRIDKFITRILQDPYYNAHYLTKKKGVDLTGKMSRHMTANFVFVYAVCEDCISKGFQKYNECRICDNTPQKRVIFFAFDKHEDIYSKRWRI